jgi:hypothetical protein
VPTPQDVEAAQQRRIAAIKGSMARISVLKQQLARARSLSDRHRIQQQIRQLQGKINPAS